MRLGQMVPPIRWFVALAALLSCATEEAPVELTAATAFDFVLGDWDVDMSVVPEGAAIGPRASMRAYRVLDGTAIVDEWRHYDAAGEAIVFRGAGFRTFIPGAQHWYVLWMMAEVEGYSELTAELVNGEIHTAGSGRDTNGDLVERGRYFDISPRSFSFTLERSYDGGTTWHGPFVAFQARRR